MHRLLRTWGHSRPRTVLVLSLSPARGSWGLGGTPPPAPGSDVALAESAHRPGARDRGPPWAACLHPAQPEAPKAPLAGRNPGALTCQPCQSQNVRAISPNEAIGWSQEQARSGGHIDKLARPPVDGRHLGVIGRLKARPAGESGERPRPPPLGAPAPPSPGASQSYQALVRGGRPSSSRQTPPFLLSE